MIPETTGWNEYQETVDETEFTPWAQKGWLAHNGQLHYGVSRRSTT